jgi:hypothetical protein
MGFSRKGEKMGRVGALLRCAPVAHPGLHICLSLGICAIARVFLRRAFGAARSSPDMWGLS